MFLAYFAARALGVTGGIGRNIEQIVRRYLAAAWKGGPYAYDRAAPPDADDTAFALRLRMLLGDRVEVHDISRALAPFAFRDTWLTFARSTASPREWAVHYEDDRSIVGPHPEVHLNVVALFREAGHPIAVGMHPAQELPENYHYPSRAYFAWQLREALPLDSRGLFDTQLLALQEHDGGWPGVEAGFNRVQESALAMLALSADAARGSAGRRGMSFLESCQREDGGWDGGVLWVFHVPRTGGSVIWRAYDSGSIMATSLALMALRAGSPSG